MEGIVSFFRKKRCSPIILYVNNGFVSFFLAISISESSFVDVDELF